MPPITPFQQNQADDMPRGKSPRGTSTNFLALKPPKQTVSKVKTVTRAPRLRAK
jgi:hypothetical protein